MWKFDLATSALLGLTWALHKEHQAPSTEPDDEKRESQMSISTLGRHKLWAIYHLNKFRGPDC